MYSSIHGLQDYTSGGQEPSTDLSKRDVFNGEEVETNHLNSLTAYRFTGCLIWKRSHWLSVICRSSVDFSPGRVNRLWFRLWFASIRVPSLQSHPSLRASLFSYFNWTQPSPIGKLHIVISFNLWILLRCTKTSNGASKPSYGSFLKYDWETLRKEQFVHVLIRDTSQHYELAPSPAAISLDSLLTIATRLPTFFTRSLSSLTSFNPHLHTNSANPSSHTFHPYFVQRTYIRRALMTFHLCISDPSLSPGEYY